MAQVASALTLASILTPIYTFITMLLNFTMLDSKAKAIDPDSRVLVILSSTALNS